MAPGYVIPGLVSLALVGVLFTTLGADQYGLWALMYALASGVPLLTTSAVEGLILRYQHRTDGQMGRRDWAISLVATAVVSAAASWVLLPQRTPETVAATSLLSVSVGAYLIRTAQLRADLRFAATSVTASLRAVTGGILASLGAVLAGSAVAATAGMAIGFLMAIALSTLGRWESPEPAVNAPTTERADRLSYGFASLVIAVALLVLSYGDRFIISIIRPLGEVGVYAAVYSVVDLVIRLGPAVLAVALRPRVFRAWDVDKSSRIVDLVGAVSSITLWGSCALSLVLVAVSQRVTADVERQNLVGPIAIGISAAAVASAMSFLYSASERQARLAVHVVACAALNVGLNLLWVPVYGLAGAAAATTISFGVLLGLHILGLGPRIIPSRDDRAIWALSVAASILIVVGPILSIGPGLLVALILLVVGLAPVWRLTNLLLRRSGDRPGSA